jgi:mannose-1-phosphate guanylyltransferase
MKAADKPLVLILCGGRSLRLWPLSRYKSKNFLDIFGFSPLELTIRRFLKITTAERIFLVTGQKEKKSLGRIRSVRKSNIIYEPESKNTAAAVLLALLKLRGHARSNIIITPVDHYIKNEKEFRRSLELCLSAAGRGYICTLGIKPRGASSNFGYIQAGRKENRNIFSVKKFIEKPGLRLARRLIKSGRCFYNSGIFISSVGVLLGEYKRYYPYYSEFLKAHGTRGAALLYRKIKDTPFDKAIMEKSQKIKLVKGAFFWRDFGSWQAIYEILPKDRKGNIKKGLVHIEQGKNNLIYIDDVQKKILLMGIQDVFFIDTKDYALLTTRAHIDKLKSVLKRFEYCNG